MKKGEVVEIVKEFYQKVLSKKPPVEKMREEAKLMGLKLRPVHGDLFRLAAFRNDKLVEIVWFIGKLDEFLHRQRRRRITEKEIDQVLEAVNEVYGDELVKGLSPSDLKNLGVELEIVKQVPLKEKFN